ncbi:hypothetical protein BD414DRAFT_21958 [Trametes punicea]|nr:hypothetical protein BD414DRAFT_21958 [Trametes punicea]
MVTALLSTLQTYFAQQRQPSQSQTAAVSVMQPPTVSVGAALDDKERLVRALRSCKAQGISPCQAIEKLDHMKSTATALRPGRMTF